jgi:hypothetical protein
VTEKVRVVVEVPRNVGIEFVARGPKVIGFEFNTDTQVYEVMIEYSKDIIKFW